MANRTVMVAVTIRSDGQANWSFNNADGANSKSQAGTGEDLIKTSEGDITYQLDQTNSTPGLTFADQSYFTGTDAAQLSIVGYTSTAITVQDSFSSSTGSAGLRLYVQNQQGVIFTSPDPEVTNTANNEP